MVSMVMTYFHSIGDIENADEGDHPLGDDTLPMKR